MPVMVPDVVELMDREPDEGSNQQQNEDLRNVKGRHTYALMTKY